MSSPVLSDISESDLTSTTPPDFVRPPQIFSASNVTNEQILAMIDAKLRPIQIKLDNADRERAELKSYYKTLTEENEDLKKKVKELENAVVDLEVEIEEHGETMAELVKSLEEIQPQIEKLKNQNLKLEETARIAEVNAEKLEKKLRKELAKKAKKDEDNKAKEMIERKLKKIDDQISGKTNDIGVNTTNDGPLTQQPAIKKPKPFFKRFNRSKSVPQFTNPVPPVDTLNTTNINKP